LDAYVQLTAPEDVTPEVHVRTPEEWAGLVQSVGELRQAGLTIKKISLRLGIPHRTASDACEESSFDGNPARPPHGTKSRWKTGCSCALCTEAKEADPLIAEVRRLRGERKSYPTIARTLGISPAKAWQAGKDAGFTGWPERPADEPSPREKELAKRAEDRARAGAHFQPWTEADEQTVMDSDLPPKELAAMLGRTPASIQNKRRELTANAAKSPDRRRSRRWSQEDDNTLMREDLTPQEKADRLGRSYAAVQTRRSMLRTAGTPKPATAAGGKPAERARRPWTPEDVATAKRDDVPVSELAAMLGRTKASVYGIRHHT
jgi:DNA-binding CsgD family transcriptional regulator